MKTAIYIEDGVTQLVITPETEFEKQAIESLGDEGVNAKIMRGSFYDCRGGWVRQGNYVKEPYGESGDKSLIIKVVA